jgi:autotransporter-associated beta strand protein
MSNRKYSVQTAALKSDGVFCCAARIRRRFQPWLAGSLAAVAALSLLDARAADGTWTQTVSGGSWSTTGNWSGGIVADGLGSTANFNTLDLTADNTVRLDSDRTLTSLIFGDTNTTTAAGWVLDNNATATNNLILAGVTPTVTVNALGSGKTATISAIIEGTAGLTKSGAGTLTLSGVNTYSGTTSVSAGILAITSNNALGATGGGNGTTVSNNAALWLNATGLTVAEPLTIRGDGSNFTGALFNNSGTNTYSGLITVDPAGGARIGSNNNTTLNLTGGVSSAGGSSLALRPGAGGAIQITTTALTLNANALFIYESGTVTLGVAGSSFGTVTPGFQGTLKAGAANVLPSSSILSLGVTGGVNAGTGTFDLAGFSQTIGGIRTTASVTEGTRTVTNSSGTATLTVDQSTNTTYDGRFTNALALTKQGAGALTLSGSTANTFTGLTTVTGGTLELGKTAGVNAIAGDGTAGTVDVRVNAGATLRHLTANQIADNATLDINAGTWNLNGQSETIRNVTAAVVSGTAPTLNLGTGSVLTLNRIDWDNSGSQVTSTIGGGSVGATSGTIRFVADGGTQAIFDANYTGNVNVNSAVQVDGTSLSFRSSTWATSLYGQVSGAGKIISDPAGGGGELLLANAANSYSGGTQWTSNTGTSGAWQRLSVTASGALGSGNVTIQGGNQNTWVSGFSGKPTAFVFTNTTTQSNNFTLSGNATIAAGDADGSTPSSDTVTLSGSFGLDNYTLFVRGRGTGTISGVISGAGGITKIDNPGTWILSGTSTYTGPTTVSAGTLRAGAAAGGQAFGNGSAVALADVAGVSLDLNGFSQTIGSLAGGGSTGGNVTLGANAMLTTGGNNGSTSYGGVISGTGTSGLTKLGTGTQTLSGVNTYNGSTTIKAGALKLGVAGDIASSQTIVVGDTGSSGAVLDLSEKTSFAIGASQMLTGIGTVRLGNSDTLTINGTLSPGNSPGVITLDSQGGGGTVNLAGTTLMEIWGTARGANPGYDAVDVTNSTMLNFGGILQLDLNQQFADDTTFDLFSTLGGSTLVQNFTGVTVTGAFYTGLTWSQAGAVWKSSNTTGGQSLEFSSATGQLVIVPEPATLALLSAGVALLGVRLARRCYRLTA